MNYLFIRLTFVMIFNYKIIKVTKREIGAGMLGKAEIIYFRVSKIEIL